MRPLIVSYKIIIINLFKDKITFKVYNDKQLRRRVNEKRQYD